MTQFLNLLLVLRLTLVSNLLFHRILDTRQLLRRPGPESPSWHPSADPVPIDVDLLFFEVLPVLLVNEYQIQQVLHRELVLYIRIRGCEIEACQVEPHGDALVLHRRSIHDLELRERLILHLLRAGRWACRLSADDLQLHVLDLDAHEHEVDLADDHVPHVVVRLVELELDPQHLLDADLHLDGLRGLRFHDVLHHHVHFLGDGLVEGLQSRDADEVPQAHILATIRFVVFRHVAESPRELFVLEQRPRRLEVLRHGKEVVGLTSVVDHVYLADELDLDALVLELAPRAHGDGGGASDILAIRQHDRTRTSPVSRQWRHLRRLQLVQLDLQDGGFAEHLSLWRRARSLSRLAAPWVPLCGLAPARPEQGQNL